MSTKQKESPGRGVRRSNSDGCNPLTFLDFFAGAGLVRLGLESSWSCSWANDIDARKREVYEAQFGAAGFVLDDIANVDATSLPAGADMAWASFPCQDLSLAGWRRGMRAERSGTYWEFWKLMRDLLDQGDRPPLIVVENVVGMLYGDDFQVLCESLAALGMAFGPLVIDARIFVPQSRPRVFVVAVDSRVDSSAFAHAEVTGDQWFTKAVRSAYERIPDSLRDQWIWWKFPIPSSNGPSVETLIEDSPTDVEWHDPAETARLLDMMTAINRNKTDQAMQHGPSVGFLYKRVRHGVQRAEVRFDGIAGCLRTPQGGSSRQIVVTINNGEVRSRLLSPREAARLMGVPDLFWLPHNYNDAYRAIGDGVAVPVVSWLSDQLLEPLGRLCQESPTDVRGKDCGTSGQTWTSRQRHVEELAMSRAR